MPAHQAKRATREWLASLVLQERKERGYISIIVSQFNLTAIFLKGNPGLPGERGEAGARVYYLKILMNTVNSLIKGIPWG